jgi:hypothetical protein
LFQDDLLKPYVHYIKNRLCEPLNPREAAMLGKAIAVGLRLENQLDKVQEQIQAFGFETGLVKSFYPRITTDEPYKDLSLKPLSTLAVNLNRVLYGHDRHAIEHGLGGTDSPFAYDYKARNRYEGNCCSVLLAAAAALSGHGERTELLGVIQWQFIESIKVGYYKDAFLPQTELWGQHSAFFVNIPGGHDSDVDDAKFKQMKVKAIRNLFIDGYEAEKHILGSKEKVKVPSLFEYHRKGRAEVMLTREGVKREEWEKVRTTKEFQNDLQRGMEAAELRFIRGYLNASPDRGLAVEQLKVMGFDKDKIAAGVRLTDGK